MEKFNSQLFLRITFIGVIAVILSNNYLLQLTKSLVESLPSSEPLPNDLILRMILIIQNSFYVLILSFFGVKLYLRAGFMLPVFLEPKILKQEYVRYVFIPALVGLVTGGLIVILSVFINPLHDTQVVSTSILSRVGASFYGGVLEEIITRFFLVSLFVVIFSKLRFLRMKGNMNYYLAIIIAAILFGVGHLPLAYRLAEPSLQLTMAIISINSVGGIVFGYLYWKRGLAAAMIAHFMADIVILIIWPLLSFV